MTTYDMWGNVESSERLHLACTQVGRLLEAAWRRRCNRRNPAPLRAAWPLGRARRALRHQHQPAPASKQLTSTAATTLPPLPAAQVDPAEFFHHPVALGANLYDKSRPKVEPPQRKGEWAGAAAAAAAAAGLPPTPLQASAAGGLQAPASGAGGEGAAEGGAGGGGSSYLRKTAVGCWGRGVAAAGWCPAGARLVLG